MARSASASATSAPGSASAACCASSRSIRAKRPTARVHHGGPVEPGRGFVLHSSDWGGQDTLHVNGEKGELFAMTGTIDVLRAIAEGRGPEQWIAALGYAGWGEGQLDEEMTRHGWFAARGDTGDPVRHAGRRALGGGVQGGGHRPAAARERDRGGLSARAQVGAIARCEESAKAGRHPNRRGVVIDPGLRRGRLGIHSRNGPVCQPKVHKLHGPTCAHARGVGCVDFRQDWPASGAKRSKRSDPTRARMRSADRHGSKSRDVNRARVWVACPSKPTEQAATRRPTLPLSSTRSSRLLRNPSFCSGGRGGGWGCVGFVGFG